MSQQQSPISTTHHMAVLSFLETLGKDITIGIQAATPIVSTLNAPVGLILSSVGNLLHNVLNMPPGSAVPTPQSLSAAAQAIATTHTIANATQAAILPVPSPGTSIGIPINGTLTFSQPLPASGGTAN